jgi:hypothetical protein
MFLDAGMVTSALLNGSTWSGSCVANGVGRQQPVKKTNGRRVA